MEEGHLQQLYSHEGTKKKKASHTVDINALRHGAGTCLAMLSETAALQLISSTQPHFSTFVTSRASRQIFLFVVCALLHATPIVIPSRDGVLAHAEKS